MYIKPLPICSNCSKRSLVKEIFANVILRYKCLNCGLMFTKWEVELYEINDREIKGI